MPISQKSKGFSLIELMIVLVLSLLITYSIAQVLISSNQSSVTSDGVSQAQETGRFTVSFMSNFLRIAGKDSEGNNATAPTSNPFIAACNDVSASFSDEGVCSSESRAGTGDRIAVSSVRTAVPGEAILDCTNATGHSDPIVPYVTDDTIVDVFWVDFDAVSGMNSLYCQGFKVENDNVVGWSDAQVVASGVEAIHALYGEASQPLALGNRPNVSMYVPADQVDDWSRVYAIKIAILTRSLSDGTNEITDRSYILLDSAGYTYNDTVHRQLYSTTYFIPNIEN